MDVCCFFFFFSSRRRHTRFDCDWSSDVCSSDLFGFCETPVVLEYLTRWVRLRLRAALWRQWKTPRRRRAALLELGVRPRLASNTAGKGAGPLDPPPAKTPPVGASHASLKTLRRPTSIV